LYECWRNAASAWSLALSSAFFRLKDPQRNRLADKLTDQVIDNTRKNQERDAIVVAVSAASVVNSRVRNIFNGHLLVPVNEIIPALNSI
jgi:hypothetical protein